MEWCTQCPADEFFLSLTKSGITILHEQKSKLLKYRRVLWFCSNIEKYNYLSVKLDISKRASIHSLLSKLYTEPGLTTHSKNRATWLLSLLTCEGKSGRLPKIDPNFNVSFPATACSPTFHKNERACTMILKGCN